MGMGKKRNQYPFVFLFIIHTGLLLYTFYKRKDRKRLLVLLFANIGIAYSFEYVVLNLFHAYRYKPRFLKRPYMDSVFGAILSQGIYVPFTSLFITALGLGWKVKLLFSLYFFSVEKWFLRMGVYRHRWWKAIYTGLLMPVYFIISDSWYNHLKKGTSSILFFSLFFMIMVTGVNLMYMLTVFRSFQKFGFGWFHTWKEHFILAPIYSIALSLFTAWSVWRNGSTYRLKSLLFAMTIDWMMRKWKVVKTREPFSIVILLHMLMIFLSGVYKRWIVEVKKAEDV